MFISSNSSTLISSLGKENTAGAFHWQVITFRCARHDHASPAINRLNVPQSLSTSVVDTTHTHTLHFKRPFFPGEPGLASCPIDNSIALMAMMDYVRPCPALPWHCVQFQHHISHHIMSPVPRGLQGCKNRPAQFPGRMLQKATKPGSVCPVS